MKKYIISGLIIILVLTITFMPAKASRENLNLTDAEREFIKSHPVIHLGVDPKFVPFEFIDENNEYDGIAKDYLTLISQSTGLTFYIEKNLTWPQAYELAKEGKLDALPAIGKTPEREEYFLLSEPYYYFKRAIAAKNTDTHISGINDLEGHAVAVQKNSSHHSYLLNYEKIDLNLYETVEAALAAVVSGEEIAFIGNLATTNYLARTNGLTDLRLITFEAEKSQALYFAARKDWPELISIFNKAVKSITDAEKVSINNKWISLDTHIDFTPYIRMALLIFGFLAAIIGVSFFWIRKLRREIQEKIKAQNALECANKETYDVNCKLKEINEELKKMSMVDGLTGINNRRYFDSFLQKIWNINRRENFPVALIMIDIDRFKDFNDTFGHLGGDECLKIIADTINKSIRRKGDFVSRYGGEEFAVILSNTTEDGAEVLAERIRVSIERTLIEVCERSASVTVSLGVASLVSAKDVEPEDLIQAADNALYEAKRTGRNKTVKAKALK